uniref:hypothetical protein n=1 Tax=Succinivibrio sp. TaxID=2053619 RepID=UPI00402A8E31
MGRETANKRKMQRLYLETPVNVYQASGICSRTIMRDLSRGGCGGDDFVSGELIIAEGPNTDIG